jgi:undecaprenyl-phosphate galactose phosphotransferase/putative colanic acid biosynthesis UDP-glucose lipid carrier transferase
VIIMLSCLISGVGYNWAFVGNVPSIQTYAGIGALTCINLSAILAARGDYRVIKLLSFHQQVRELTILWTGLLLVLISVAFALKITAEFSRGATFTFFVMGLSSLIALRRFVGQFLSQALSTGAFASRNVIVIGERNRLATSGTIFEIRRCGYVPIRTLAIEEDQFGAARISGQLQTTINSAIEAARTEPVAEILLLIGWEHNSAIESISKHLSVLPIPVYLLPDDNVSRFLRNRCINVGVTWAAEIQREPLTKTEQLLKRCFDAVGAVSVLLLLFPLMLTVALLIKLDSPGPVLFFQTRNGFNSRAFRIVKFRTMYVLEDGHEIRQATRADPRVTCIGRWLRRANIDELPQLFNVLKGEMSLVGPRPHAVAHNSEFEKVVANYAFRHNVKPGITGWAQVNGFRGETPTAEAMAKRVELDIWYINNWSMSTDIRILVRTLILGIQPTAY